MQKNIEKSYQSAKEQYATYGVNTDEVLKQLSNLVVSLHCWQTDDVSGFENPDTALSGGIQTTGNYPGKARTIEEVQMDLEKSMSLLPGIQKVNLHAIYGDFTKAKKERDEIGIENFQSWIDWAKANNTSLDFNATCFSHKKADSGFTLSSKDEDVRNFWVEHVKKCRKIANEMGRQLQTPCVHNLWIPDGSKDIPVDRFTHRQLLKKSLDEIFSIDFPKENLKDAVESKLFGIGSEAMVVGSHDFYLAYAIQNNKLICLDNGHFHPTEQIGDKISACLQFLPEILLHITRGVRWDSDHVVTLNDDVLLIAQEVIRSKAFDKVNVALDFFDASINRIGAYVTGTRSTQKAFLIAMLEPFEILRKYEENNRNFERLFLLEQTKSMPWGAVWDYFCLQNNVLQDNEVIEEIATYESKILNNRK